MTRYQGRRDFRAGRGAIVMIVVLTMIFATGAVMTYREREWTWVSLCLAGMTVLSLAGIVETLVMRVQLTDEALWMTDLRGRRSYPIQDITGVGDAKGVPTAIFLADGRVVRLPLVGDNMGNSIRAWLKHSS